MEDETRLASPTDSLFSFTLPWLQDNNPRFLQNMEWPSFDLTTRTSMRSVAFASPHINASHVGWSRLQPDAFEGADLKGKGALFAE